MIVLSVFQAIFFLAKLDWKPFIFKGALLANTTFIKILGSTLNKISRFGRIKERISGICRTPLIFDWSQARPS
jgi:hypothetical protein